MMKVKVAVHPSAETEILLTGTESLICRDLLSRIRVECSREISVSDSPLPLCLCLEFREVPFLLELDDLVPVKSLPPDVMFTVYQPRDLPASHLPVSFFVQLILAGGQNDSKKVLSGLCYSRTKLFALNKESQAHRYFVDGLVDARWSVLAPPVYTVELADDQDAFFEHANRCVCALCGRSVRHFGTSVNIESCISWSDNLLQPRFALRLVSGERFVSCQKGQTLREAVGDLVFEEGVDPNAPTMEYRWHVIHVLGQEFFENQTEFDFRKIARDLRKALEDVAWSSQELDGLQHEVGILNGLRRLIDGATSELLRKRSSDLPGRRLVLLGFCDTNRRIWREVAKLFNGSVRQILEKLDDSDDGKKLSAFIQQPDDTDIEKLVQGLKVIAVRLSGFLRAGQKCAEIDIFLDSLLCLPVQSWERQKLEQLARIQAKLDQDLLRAKKDQKDRLAETRDT
jgi:hypothetical protein